MSTIDSRPSIERALDALVSAIYSDDKTTLLNGLALRKTLVDIQGSEEAFDLFLGDLNSFKEVNSRHGYDGGDAAIARAGDVLSEKLDSLIREHGVKAFRQSGDEFAIVAPSKVSMRVAKLLSAFKSIEVSFKKACFEISGSFGQTKCLKELTPEDWKTRAEMALYHAKIHTEAVVVVWIPGLNKPAEKLRRRCKSCRASYAVTPTDTGIREEHLTCPQCGRPPSAKHGPTAKKPAKLRV